MSASPASVHDVGVRLGDICEAIVDCEHKTSPIDLSGDYWAVGTPAMRDGRINYAEARRISRPTFDAWTRRLRPSYGDILLAREAPVGPVVMIPEAENVAPGQRTVLLRPDPAVVLPAYLYFLLRSPTEQARLKMRAEGSTVAHLNVADIRVHQLPSLPSLSVQRGIVATLGALDDKIESNSRIITSSRALGSALYAQRVEIGARTTSLVALASSIARGVAPQYVDDDSTAPLVLNQKCVRDGLISTAYARRMRPRAVSAEKKARAGDILVNSTGIGTLGRVARWSGEETFVDGHITVVRPDARTCPPTILAHVLLAAQSRIEALAIGSTGQTELSRERLGSLTVAIPDGDLTELGDGLASLENRLEGARQESKVLASLRDTLLPELLSERILVPGAEKMVANAT